MMIVDIGAAAGKMMSKKIVIRRTARGASPTTGDRNEGAKILSPHNDAGTMMPRRIPRAEIPMSRRKLKVKARRGARTKA